MFFLVYSERMMIKYQWIVPSHVSLKRFSGPKATRAALLTGDNLNSICRRTCRSKSIGMELKHKDVNTHQQQAHLNISRYSLAVFCPEFLWMWRILCDNSLHLATFQMLNLGMDASQLRNNISGVRPFSVKRESYLYKNKISEVATYLDKCVAYWRIHKMMSHSR